MSGRENPFAGLRPYDVEESYLFFGREKAVDELLLRLGRDNFLAVLGPSGSGKSSVVRAGLIPSLEAGQLRRAGPRWRVAIMRPGGDPFGHLASALAHEELLGGELDAAQARAMILSRLRRGSRGLKSVMDRSSLGDRENLLILVDQFEELFRFAQDQQDGVVDDEAAAFVQLLLDAAEAPTDRLYVALTMRSDFLGDCARYRGLAEALSRFMYLVPRMTRSERRAAIEGPIAIETARAEPRLVSRLLNEADDAPDQLPVLQHALQQTWEAAAADVEDGRPLDSKHYVAAGGIAGALDQHAQQALGELSDVQQELGRRVFQTITELGPDNRGIRRPTRLGSIASITGASLEEVLAVLEPFRREGRGFVMPRMREVPEPTTDTVIDISHEALMRAWGTLEEWVKEEAESVATYRRLSQTAAQFPDDPEWRYLDPALTGALHWRQATQPTREWGERHEPNFEEAMAFLDRSRDHRDAAVTAAALEAKRKLEAAEALAAAEHHKLVLAKRNARITRVFLGIALLMMVFAWFQYSEARQATADAVASLQAAREAQVTAQEAEADAKLAEGAAMKSATEAVLKREEALMAEVRARINERKAELAQAAALKDQARAEQSAQEAETAHAAAELALAKSEVRRVAALLKEPGVERAELLASALTSVASMRGRDDPELDAVVRDLLRDFGGPTTPLPAKSRTVALAPNGRWAAFGIDTQGAVVLNPTRPSQSVTITGHEGSVSIVRWDSRGDRVAVADDTGHITVWSMDKGAAVGTFDHPAPVRAVEFDPTSKLLVSTGDDGSARVWDLESGNELAALRSHTRAVFQATFRSTGDRMLATAGDDGKVCLWTGPQLVTDGCTQAHASWIHSLAFSPSGGELASAGDDGLIFVLRGLAGGADPEDFEAKSLRGHEGPVTSVQWSPDGRNILSGSFDRSARLWSVADGDEITRFTGHQGWVWDARGVWSGSLQHVVTAGADGLVRIFDPQGRMVREFAGDGAAVRSLALDVAGRWLSWGGSSGGRLVDLESSVGQMLPRSLDQLIGVGCRWLSSERPAHAAVDSLWAAEERSPPCGT